MTFITKYIFPGVVIMAVGAILGISGYKKLYPILRPPAPVCQVQEDVKKEIETRTVVRYIDAKGQPASKEVVVVQKEQKATKPLPIPRPKNIIGITGLITPKGGSKVGPLYGRELFPNFYVTGSVLLTPQSDIRKLEPELLIGVQLFF